MSIEIVQPCLTEHPVIPITEVTVGVWYTLTNTFLVGYLGMGFVVDGNPCLILPDGAVLYQAHARVRRVKAVSISFKG